METQQDGASLGQTILRLGLVDQDQLAEVWTEIGQRNCPAEQFFRLLERKSFLTSWQRNKVLKGDTTGFFMGGYRLQYKIASGSFGRVFRADDVGSGRVVAVKVLRKRWTENPHHVQLFEREGRVGLSLQHPNIVETLQVSKDPLSGSYYMVMEFVEGGNLRDILKLRGKLQPEHALRIIEDAAAGLAYAFSQHINHRDIKLSNILLSSQGLAKLVDFGLANFLARVGARHAGMDDEGDNKEERVDRTVDYAGLEKCTGVGEGDKRSDIYFMGCVLYEILSGRAPLKHTKNPQSRMQRQRFEQVKPLGPDEIKAPGSLFQLIETMMALNPGQRYQTPHQMYDAVRAARADLTGKAPTNGSAAAAKPVPSIFVVQSDPNLQDPIRDKLKKLGYKVLLAATPERTLDVYNRQPFDGLIVDAGTTGIDGFHTFERVLGEAERHRRPCVGILMLSEDQRDWLKRLQTTGDHVKVLVRPVTMKQLWRNLWAMLPGTVSKESSQ